MHRMRQTHSLSLNLLGAHVETENVHVSDQVKCTHTRARAQCSCAKSNTMQVYKISIYEFVVAATRPPLEK